MKSAGDVAHKLKQVQFRHAKKEIEQHLSRTPYNCAYQKQLDVKGLGRPLGFCTHPEVGLKACDSASSELNRAPTCPKFTLRMSEQEARESVKAYFKESSPAEIAAKYPDVAALMWTLDDEEIEPPPEPFSISALDGIPLWTTSAETAKRAAINIEGMQNDVRSFLRLQKDYDALASRYNILSIEQHLLKRALVTPEASTPKPQPKGLGSFFKSLFFVVCFVINSVFHSRRDS